MFVKLQQIQKNYSRPSKYGKVHSYSRKQSIAFFRCDNCDREFDRQIGKMDHRRLSNGYFHVCPECDTKRFAQKKAVERRTVWNLQANSDISIVKL